MTILITGARGGIGRSLLHRLHASGLEVRAGTRDPDQTDLPEGVTAVALDLATSETFSDALHEVTDVFLYAEPAAINAFLDTAISSGVRRVVLLSSDSVTVCDGDHNALARHHLVVERALLDSPLTATVLRPGGFATMALGWAEFIRAGLPVEQAYPDAQLDVIHPEDIADVAELALTTNILDGQTVSLGGPEVLRFRDQVRILGQLLGREIEIREPTPQRAAALMASHVPQPLVDAVLDYWAQLPRGRTEAARTVEGFTGQPGRTFRQWATEGLASFR